MRTRMPSAGAVQLTVKPTWRGLVIYRRDALPDLAPGTWYWGNWRKATITDLAYCIKKLTEDQ